jgi:hypothetical protein
MRQLPNVMYLASIWVIPLVIAITFHEAAHGFVARFLGDETAWRLGRVSLNPLKHIDPTGTVLLPGLLLLLGSPFLFGYAKPVPVNFRALRNPRTGMVWVAVAGPAMNIALAILAALAFHLVEYLPVTRVASMSQTAAIIASRCSTAKEPSNTRSSSACRCRPVPSRRSATSRARRYFPVAPSHRAHLGRSASRQDQIKCSIAPMLGPDASIS